MALTRGLRASKNRLSSRVSSSAGTFSATSRGRGVAERLTISIASGMSSLPPGAFPSGLTVPVTLTTDSRDIARIVSAISGATFFFGTVTWIIPVLSRIKRKARPPRSRISCAHPITSAEGVSGVMVLIGTRILYPYSMSGNAKNSLWPFYHLVLLVIQEDSMGNSWQIQRTSHPVKTKIYF